jgi:hypothetical protein
MNLSQETLSRPAPPLAVGHLVGLMTTDEKSAFMEHEASVREYLSAQSHYCRQSVSLTNFIASKHADTLGVWTEADGAHVGAALSDTLKAALAKADAHLPTLSQSNPLPFE